MAHGICGLFCWPRFSWPRRWRACFWLAGCWAAGTILGALLTGKPLAFLYGAVFMAQSVYGEHAPKWMLVGGIPIQRR